LKAKFNQSLQFENKVKSNFWSGTIPIEQSFDQIQLK